jgi:hypothetical protein
MIEARSGREVFFDQVTLFVGDEAIRTFSQPPYRAWWGLRPGEHQVYAVGQAQDGTEIHSEMVTIVVVK